MYEGCSESNSPFLRSKCLLRNNENNTYSSEKDCLQTLFLPQILRPLLQLAPM
jgi:hypothetical protein